MTDEIKPWIVEFKNLVRIVKCPYCGHEDVFPYPKCGNCHKEINFPEEAKVVKKEWW